MFSNSSLTAAEIRRPHRADEYARNRVFQGIPAIAALPCGGIAAVWYSGGITEGPDNYCVLAYGRNNIEDLQEPWFIIRHKSPHVRCFDPNVWVTPQGELMVIWNQSESAENGSIFDGRGGVWTAVCKNPEAETPVWSNPVRIADGVQMNKPVVLSNGEWAFPTALWNDLEQYGAKKVVPELRNAKYSNITISSDGGRTFELRGGADVAERCFDEHMIIEKKDHSLQMYVRTLYGIGTSFSEDMGRTWSRGVNSNISSPNTRFYVGRLSSGNLLLIHNVDDSGKDYREHPWRPRRNLSARISCDDGKTWGNALLLDERSGTSYPDACQDETGAIWIIYDHARYKGGHIYIAKITESDISAQKLISEGSYLKREISSYPWKNEDENAQKQ